MSKVIRFPGKKTPDQESQEVIVARLEEILERAKAGEVKGFLLGAFTNEPHVIATSWGSVNFGQRMELISHMHMDLMAAMVEKNFFSTED